MCQEAYQDHIESDWFTQEFWLNQGRLLGANSGRGSTWIIKSEFGKWVLRHYYRGGMMAKLFRDKYLWTGINNCRAFREFNLLHRLHEMGLPCPKPVAVKVIKNGFFYRNDIIMEHIKHRQTFAKALIEQTDRSEDWADVGAMIKQFHQKHVCHADLNTHNILLGNDGPTLIDFDNGEIKTNQRKWPDQNLARLKRSIEKETGLSCDDDLKPQWEQLNKAYNR